MKTEAFRLEAEIKESIFERELRELQRLTDRVFGYLLVAQWFFGVGCAVIISPKTWEGMSSTTHTHVWAAIVVGGALVSLPLWLIWKFPGEPLTRWVVASAQVMFSGLLIHLMGGRIEAHFHVFGSLALLAFYRDAYVFLPAVALIFLDHLFRGLFWPESVFGVFTPSVWRAFEHAGWVLFETIFLLWGIHQGREHLRKLSQLQLSLMKERDSLEGRVQQRTSEVARARDYSEHVLDSLDAAICILDCEGKILSINHAWREFAESNGSGARSCFEFENFLHACDAAAEIQGKAVSDLAAAIRVVIEAQAETRVVEYPYHSGSKMRWFQARIAPFVGDDEAAVVVAHVDVTERVIATRSFVEQSRRATSLAQIIHESPNEVYIFSQADLRFEEVNQGACEATGYNRKELLRMTPVDLKSEFDSCTFRQHLEPLRQDQVSMLEFQTIHRRKGGETYPVQVKLNKSVFQGVPVYVAFVTDLTAVQQLEHQLSQAQKLESIGQLAAGVAHEINTPMQFIGSNIEFFQQSMPQVLHLVDQMREWLGKEAIDTEPESRLLALQELLDQKRYDFLREQIPAAIEDCAEGVQRVVEIVSAMKAFSHPGTQDKSMANLNEMLSSASIVSRNRWKFVAEMQLELDPQAPEVLCHPAELNQVWLNLIVNAADAIAENHPEGELGKIWLRSYFEQEQLVIECEDTGGGMPDSIVQRVFDPFFTTKDVGKGTGQGLAIAHDIVVNRHGGTFEVESTEGQGSLFRVCLPLSSDDADPADAESLVESKLA